MGCQTHFAKIRVSPGALGRALEAQESAGGVERSFRQITLGHIGMTIACFPARYAGDKLNSAA